MQASHLALPHHCSYSQADRPRRFGQSTPNTAENRPSNNHHRTDMRAHSARTHRTPQNRTVVLQCSAMSRQRAAVPRRVARLTEETQLRAIFTAAAASLRCDGAARAAAATMHGASGAAAALPLPPPPPPPQQQWRRNAVDTPSERQTRCSHRRVAIAPCRHRCCRGTVTALC